MNSFDIFQDKRDEECTLENPFEFLLGEQKNISSHSELDESNFKLDDVNFKDQLKTVTERKKRNVKTSSAKKGLAEKKVGSIKFLPYKPHFIPTEVQLSLFKASVIGRNDAEKFLKKSGIKQCTTSVLSSGKFSNQNENRARSRSSSVPKKRTTLFSKMDIPNKVSLTPEMKLSQGVDLNETRNCSTVPYKLHGNSTLNDIELRLLQSPKTDGLVFTPKMNKSSRKSIAPLSGIRKLVESPCTSLSNTPVLNSFARTDTSASPKLDDVACTQSISTIILDGVVAFVDVRSDSENRSQGVKDVLLSLGAKIENYFTRKVTIVVFKDGLMSTYKRAKLWKVSMVSILWIEACREELGIVPFELHPPFGLNKYETALTLDLEIKKRTHKKLEEVGVNSSRQNRNKKKEQLEKSNITESINAEPTVAPRTPSHEDAFIQALLTVAEDELKDFLHRPLEHPLDEDSHIDLPLSVRLLHKHVYERRAVTSEKECSGSFEENIRKLSDKGRIKLRKLVFPSSVEEDCDTIEKSKAILKNCAYAKGSTDTFKRPENKDSINISNLAKYSFENDRKSAPAILFTGRSRQSAPAKLVTRRNRVKQNKLNVENGNIQKYFVSAADIENNVNHVNCESSYMFQKNTNKINNTNEISLPSNECKNKDKVVSDIRNNCINTNSTCLTQSQHGVLLSNLTNTGIKHKRKLLPLGSNIYLTEPVCISCEPSPVVCPYTNSPQKKNKNLPLQRMSKTFIKPALPKQQSTFSDCESNSASRRGSSILFVEAKEKKRNLKQIAPSIVCTSTPRKDVDTILAIVNQLGKFSLERIVSERTTHVITSSTRRTVNLLKGIARGIWIVKDEWIYKSYESGKWLNEEPYELIELSPAVKQSRIERLAFGPEFCLELFKHVGFIYVCRRTNPPSADLMELIRICGGKVVTNARLANVIVGPKTVQLEHNVISVTENWVLDSIYRNTQLSPQLYKQIDCQS